MDKKVISWIIISILLFELPLAVLLVSAKSAAFDLDFYKKEFDKYNPDVEDSIQTTENLLYYLKNKNADKIYISSFQENEISHLKDVKDIIQKGIIISYIFILITIILIIALYLINRKKFVARLGFICLLGGIGVWISILSNSIILLNFKGFFNSFHHLFFADGTWSFPAGYKLITLFPEQFWIDMLIRIFLYLFIIGNILILVGIYIVLTNKKAKEMIKDVIHKLQSVRTIYRKKSNRTSKSS